MSENAGCIRKIFRKRRSILIRNETIPHHGGDRFEVEPVAW